MGLRGELFSTRVVRENRSYFFNVKENRKGEMFLTIVESKHSADGTFERHQVMVFQEDFPDFAEGLDKVVAFMKKERFKRATGRGRPAVRDESRPDGSRESGEQGGEGGDIPEKPPRKTSGKVHTPKPRPRN